MFLYKESSLYISVFLVSIDLLFYRKTIQKAPLAPKCSQYCSVPWTSTPLSLMMTIVKSIWRKSIRQRGVFWMGFDRACRLSHGFFENALVSGTVTQRLNLGLSREWFAIFNCGIHRETHLFEEMWIPWLDQWYRDDVESVRMRTTGGLAFESTWRMNEFTFLTGRLHCLSMQIYIYICILYIYIYKKPL